MRLDKFISNNSIYSRKEVNKFIRKKLVKVNEQIIIDPAFKLSLENDIVKINEHIIENNNLLYIVLNKPKGYVCSNNDNDGISALNLINEAYVKNLHFIGRLDKDTTGLILLTNDGNFTHEIKSSKYKIEKEYEVILKYEFVDSMKKTLEQKIFLDNKELKPFKILNINKNKVNIILIEGKYHQIKRLFNIVENPVVELTRIRIGNLLLKDLNLKEGQYKIIDHNQLLKLKNKKI